jgi:hypothetical protein
LRGECLRDDERRHGENWRGMKRGEGWMMRGIMQRSDADRRKEDMIWATKWRSFAKMVSANKSIEEEVFYEDCPTCCHQCIDVDR